MKQILSLILALIIMMFSNYNGNIADLFSAVFEEGEIISADTIQEETADGNADYRIIIADRDGEPVQGVMLNVCNDEICQVIFTDINGEARITMEAYPYTVHILSVPDGYTLDRSREFVLNATGDDLMITLE